MEVGVLKGEGEGEGEGNVVDGREEGNSSGVGLPGEVGTSLQHLQPQPPQQAQNSAAEEHHLNTPAAMLGSLGGGTSVGQPHPYPQAAHGGQLAGEGMLPTGQTPVTMLATLQALQQQINHIQQMQQMQQQIMQQQIMQQATQLPQPTPPLPALSQHQDGPAVPGSAHQGTQQHTHDSGGSSGDYNLQAAPGGPPHSSGNSMPPVGGAFGGGLQLQSITQPADEFDSLPPQAPPHPFVVPPPSAESPVPNQGVCVAKAAQQAQADLQPPPPPIETDGEPQISQPMLATTKDQPDESHPRETAQHDDNGGGAARATTGATAGGAGVRLDDGAVGDGDVDVGGAVPIVVANGVEEEGDGGCLAAGEHHPKHETEDRSSHLSEDASAQQLPLNVDSLQRLAAQDEQPVEDIGQSIHELPENDHIVNLLSRAADSMLGDQGQLRDLEGFPVANKEEGGQNGHKGKEGEIAGQKGAAGGRGGKKLPPRETRGGSWEDTYQRGPRGRGLPRQLVFPLKEGADDHRQDDGRPRDLEAIVGRHGFAIVRSSNPKSRSGDPVEVVQLLREGHRMTEQEIASLLLRMTARAAQTERGVKPRERQALEAARREKALEAAKEVRAELQRREAKRVSLMQSGKGRVNTTDRSQAGRPPASPPANPPRPFSQRPPTHPVTQSPTIRILPRPSPPSPAAPPHKSLQLTDRNRNRNASCQREKEKKIRNLQEEQNDKKECLRRAMIVLRRLITVHSSEGQREALLEGGDWYFPPTNTRQKGTAANSTSSSNSGMSPALRSVLNDPDTLPILRSVGITSVPGSAEEATACLDQVQQALAQLDQHQEHRSTEERDMVADSDGLDQVVELEDEDLAEEARIQRGEAVKGGRGGGGSGPSG
ncbi:unnamed protein product [Vitrella brassicaformis CCMP3155]|uniref:Uncharacterized protein n=1 Tax=Vitrella brassicaformis (strain CCMP3155) TaxID=1169540 RepID=A0A0G4GXS7_VITBC|nr:unnamed protein product [Vitrella brassicaformis CCMP3155]|eukprot:CEM35907.1 unnamed protein product [Vitrella brassicaformis CCMP3155]